MPPHPESHRTHAFLNRARQEAARYGPDPWVCIRELLQNARDAGATKVEFNVSRGPDGARLVCRDDGDGMTFEDARRFLFTLYASSKTGAKRQAGRFGVGFWSVLRLEPAQITLRAHPRRGGSPWSLTFDGALTSATRGEAEIPPGTEVTLAWSHPVPGLEASVLDAVRQNGRFLRRRDDAGPLAVVACGEDVAEPFALPPPSTTISRRGMRIAVGLGKAPRVELLSKGLRIRSAAWLEDLLAPGRSTEHARVRFPELPGGLAPQALVEGDDLEVMMSRGDARDGRTLRRLVRRARREIDRLIARQVGLVSPEPVWRRALARAAAAREAIAEAFLGLRPATMFLASAATGAAVMLVIFGVALGAGTLLEGGRIARSGGGVAGAGPPGGGSLSLGAGDGPPGAGSPAHAAGDGPPAAGDAPHATGLAAGGDATRTTHSPAPLRSLASRYHAPDAEVPDPAQPPVALTYAPTGRTLFLAALVVTDLDVMSPEATLGADARARAPYAGARCGGACTRVTLVAEDAPGLFRLPVDTGARVDPDSVRVDGRPVQPIAASDGLPAVRLETDRPVEIRYAMGPAQGPLQMPRYPAPPDALAAEAEALADRPVAERARRLTDRVRERVTYRSDEATAARHRAAAAAGQTLIARSLAIGAGDCDVQNGVLAALLQAAGVEARLVVGYVGRGGVAAPGLHAWVEYRDGDGWAIADASEVTGAGAGAAVAGAGDSGTGAGLPGTEIAGHGVMTGDAATRAGPHGAGPAAGLPRSAPADSTTQSGSARARTTPSGTTPGDGRVHRYGPDAPRDGLVHRYAPAARRLAFPLASLALLAMGVVALVRRPRREEHLDAEADLAALVRGALIRPEAFGGAAALHHRRLLPCLGGGALSLFAARDLAVSGRLFVSTGGPLGEGIRAAGWAVLDGHAAASRAAAEILGAVDLDAWADRLAAAETTEWTRWLSETGTRAGLALHVVACPDADRYVVAKPDADRHVVAKPDTGRDRRSDADPHVLNLPAGALDGHPRVRRLVALDPEAPSVRAALTRLESEPETARFILAEIVTDALDLQEAEAERLLMPLAAAALEAASP